MKTINTNHMRLSNNSVLVSRRGNYAIPALRLTITLALGTLAMGCASGPEMITELIDERSIEMTIEPIPKPNWSAGLVRERVDILTDEPSGFEIIEVLENDELRMQNINGCIWDSSRDWFSPPSRWENCGTNPAWKAGSRSVKQLKGELWPLAPGNTVAYRGTPVSSSGERGTTETRRCEVTGPYNIDVAIGNVDVLKVLCSTRLWDNSMEYQSWYWAEEHGPVKYVKARQGKGVVTHSELVLTKTTE